MRKNNLFEVSSILEEQGRKVKDVQRIVELLGLSLEVLNEDNGEHIVSSLRVVESYLEHIHQELMRGWEEVKELIEETGDV